MSGSTWSIWCDPPMTLIFLHLSLLRGLLLRDLVRPSFFSITYTMRLTPFEYFKVKWLNSHILYELFGCRDNGMQVRIMDMNDDEMEEEATLHQI